MEIVEKILTSLGVSKPARAVYLDLLDHGSSNVRTLSVRLSMTRPSVYDQLRELASLGLVSERDLDGKTEFAVQDVADLERRLEGERERLGNLSQEFSAVRKQLAEKLARTERLEPKIRFLAGGDAVFQAMHDMLWDESIVLYTVWPYEEMLRVFGMERLREFNKKRIRNEVRLRSLWSASGKKKPDHHIWASEDWGVERRLAPREVAPRMGYTVYDSKVLFISSQKEAFGFLVQSDDLADLMRSQFEFLWQASGKKRSEKKRR